MIILGLDSSTSATSVALLDGAGETRERRDDVSDGSRPHHAQALLPLAHALLADAGVAWRELDAVAVGTGPGGYTGLRIGLASARGIACAHGATLCGVGSLRALASGGPPARTTLALIDARRGELFAAAASTEGEELLAPRVCAPPQLRELREELALEPPLLAVGEGALRHREALEAAGIELAPVRSSRHRLSAAVICRIAAAELAGGGPPAPAEPSYLRLADAELALRAAR